MSKYIKEGLTALGRSAEYSDLPWMIIRTILDIPGVSEAVAAAAINDKKITHVCDLFSATDETLCDLPFNYVWEILQRHDS